MLEEAWRALDKDPSKGLPVRRALSPKSLGPALVHNCILVKHTPDGYVMSLVGSGVTSRIGSDLTGKNPLYYVPPKSLPRAQFFYDQARLCPVGVWVECTVLYEDGVSGQVHTTIFPFLRDAEVALLALSERMSKTSMGDDDKPILPVEIAWDGDFEWIDLGFGLPEETPPA